MKAQKKSTKQVMLEKINFIDYDTSETLNKLSENTIANVNVIPIEPFESDIKYKIYNPVYSEINKQSS